nr:BlaI/MecI/CopY family transcriptional regulator [Clostridia bacterium]
MEIGEVQMQFAERIWEKEPIASGELVKLCADEFGWKKSTTYTVLKKLCEKGLFQNVYGVVTSLISKEEFYTRKSEQFVEETFGGSLPAFLAAFTSRQKLSSKEMAEIQKINSLWVNCQKMRSSCCIYDS